MLSYRIYHIGYRGSIIETSFQRANRLAEESKALKWAAYRQREPLPKAAFKDFDVQLMPVLTVTPGGAYRSSKQVRTYGHHYMRLRPTEDKAFKAARGEDGDDKLVVIRQEPVVVRRYCHRCKIRRMVGEFERDKRFADGLACFCRSCRKEARRRVYRRAA